MAQTPRGGLYEPPCFQDILRSVPSTLKPLYVYIYICVCVCVCYRMGHIYGALWGYMSPSLPRQNRTKERPTWCCHPNSLVNQLSCSVAHQSQDPCNHDCSPRQTLQNHHPWPFLGSPMAVPCVVSGTVSLTQIPPPTWNPPTVDVRLGTPSATPSSHQLLR